MKKLTLVYLISVLVILVIIVWTSNSDVYSSDFPTTPTYYNKVDTKDTLVLCPMFRAEMAEYENDMKSLRRIDKRVIILEVNPDYFR